MTCEVGYTAESGACVACAANCIKCDVLGSGNCDSEYCASGYATLQGTTNCSECFSGCSECKVTDLGVCVSCKNEFYLNSTSHCAKCVEGCLTCTSKTDCSQCILGYALGTDNLCYVKLDFPCSAQTGSTCTDCFLGYTLANGTCSIDLSCNNDTAKCVACPSFYYLNSTTSECSICTTTTTNCDFCNSEDPTKCLFCSFGYYLDSNLSCVPCATGCLSCLSDRYCIIQDEGYILEEDFNGEETGNTQSCSTNCLTC